MKLRFLLLIPGLILVGGTASAQTLEDVIDELLRTHPQIEAARENLSAAEEGITRAFADFLPQLSLFADYGYERTDSPATRATRDSSFNTQRDAATLTITQKLFDGYRTRSSNATARINRAVSEIVLESDQQSLIFRGAAA